MSEEQIENQEEVQEEVAEEKPQAPRELKDYESIEGRLKEIEEKVTSQDLDMEESLELYEEAVDLGMKASQTIENNVLVDTNKEEEATEDTSE